MTIDVRLALPSDAGALSELAIRTFRDTFAADNRPEDLALYLDEAYAVEQLLREIEDPNLTTLLAESGGALAGFAQLRRGSAPPPPPSAPIVDAPIELWRFYVDQPWHGRGVAATLMERVVAESLTLGARTLWLGVWERNARGIAFYKKAGFTDIGSQIFMLGTDKQTDRVMARPLHTTAIPVVEPTGP